METPLPVVFAVCGAVFVMLPPLVQYRFAAAWWGLADATRSGRRRLRYAVVASNVLIYELVILLMQERFTQ